MTYEEYRRELNEALEKADWMSRKRFCKKGGRKARRAGTGGAGHGA